MLEATCKDTCYMQVVYTRDACASIVGTGHVVKLICALRFPAAATLEDCLSPIACGSTNQSNAFPYLSVLDCCSGQRTSSLAVAFEFSVGTSYTIISLKLHRRPGRGLASSTLVCLFCSSPSPFRSVPQHAIERSSYPSTTTL